MAFAGAGGGVVRFNTIYRPRRWVLRVLQETRHDAFLPCRGGVFADNLVVYRSDEVRAAASVGAGTEAGTFRSRGNFWYCLDRPERSRPELPASEEGGTYGKDLLVADPEKGDFTPRPASAAAGAGAGALN